MPDGNVSVSALYARCTVPDYRWLSTDPFTLSRPRKTSEKRRNYLFINGPSRVIIHSRTGRMSLTGRNPGNGSITLINRPECVPRSGFRGPSGGGSRQKTKAIEASKTQVAGRRPRSVDPPRRTRSVRKEPPRRKRYPSRRRPEKRDVLSLSLSPPVRHPVT